MNKERLFQRFVQREKLTNLSPALTFLSTSRLSACLTSFCLPHASRSSLTASDVPHQPLSPSRFRLASPASLSLTLLEASSRLPAYLTNFSLPHASRSSRTASGVPHQLLSPSRFQKLPHGFRHASRFQIPHDPFPSTSNLDYLCFVQKGKALQQ